MENISVEEIKDAWLLTFQIIMMDLLYPWIWSLDTNPWWIFRSIHKHTQLAILLLEAFLDKITKISSNKKLPPVKLDLGTSEVSVQCSAYSANLACLA